MRTRPACDVRLCVRIMGASARHPGSKLCEPGSAKVAGRSRCNWRGRNNCSHARTFAEISPACMSILWSTAYTCPCMQAALSVLSFGVDCWALDPGRSKQQHSFQPGCPEPSEYSVRLTLSGQFGS